MRLLFIIIIINFLLSIIGFNLKNKITYKEVIIKAKLCKVCYSKKPYFNITKNKMMNIYDNYIFINETKTKSICFIYYNKEIIDICFKGTSTNSDVCINMDFLLKDYKNKNILIHEGFLNNYLSLKSILITKINYICSKNNIKEICFNGHSSGGVIANLASYDLSLLYKDKLIKCITFGSPKIGNKAFIEEYNKRVNISLRIVNKYDIIQYLPPIPLIYNHNHEAIELDNYKNQYSITKIIMNIYDYFKNIHAISRYIKNLSNYNLNETINK